MQRRRILTLALTFSLLTIVAVVLAACAPFTATPPSQARPLPGATVHSPENPGTPLAERATPPPAPGAQASLFAGVVKHAGQPVAGARVELRALGWATNKTPPVASVTADGQGNFSLASPPTGDFSVLGYFPDGEMDAGGWPPVSIKAGQQITGFVVPLERKLILLSPIAGSVAAPLPTLTWRAATEAIEYRVWIIDAGTTEVKLDATTRETTLTGPNELTPGEHQWVVNGLDASGQIVATGQETFTVMASGSATPAPAVTESQGPVGRPGNMPRLPDQDRAFEGVRAALAKRLGIDPLSIQRVEVTPQEWNDACLGLAIADDVCAQVMTPGWLVIAETGGRRYEAHTDQEGVRVRFVGLR